MKLLQALPDRNGFAVLDKGFVALVDSMGSDLAVVRNARVSYNADWRSDEKDASLIRYLVNNGHTSPFEAVKFTFEVKAPIFVLRQWHRHRTWSYNEISARYCELPDDYYVPEAIHIGQQASHNKQMRVLQGIATVEDVTAQRIMEAQNQRAFDAYRQLLALGVPRELARSVLPVATYSRMFATVDLHNLMGFLRLRLHEHAQYEIQVYAQAMLQIASTVCPISVKAFCDKHSIPTLPTTTEGASA